MRIELCGNLVTFAAAMFCIVARDSISPGVAGVSISYALQVGLYDYYIRNCLFFVLVEGRECTKNERAAVHFRKHLKICSVQRFFHLYLNFWIQLEDTRTRYRTCKPCYTFKYRTKRV